jgi:hypothetical protein
VGARHSYFLTQGVGTQPGSNTNDPSSQYTPPGLDGTTVHFSLVVDVVKEVGNGGDNGLA